MSARIKLDRPDLELVLRALRQAEEPLRQMSMASQADWLGYIKLIRAISDLQGQDFVMNCVDLHPVADPVLNTLPQAQPNRRMNFVWGKGYRGPLI